MSHAADCKDKNPHFVPPGFGTIGFHICNVPEDITNHTRCREGNCEVDTVEHTWTWGPIK